MQRRDSGPDDLPTAGHGYHLVPFAVVAGVGPAVDDERLMAAQSGLNRIQVWFGDLIINLAARRRRRGEDLHGQSGKVDSRTLAR
jgi:hypothetical protein